MGRCFSVRFEVGAPTRTSCFKRQVSFSHPPAHWGFFWGNIPQTPCQRGSPPLGSPRLGFEMTFGQDDLMALAASFKSSTKVMSRLD